jgi:hypothetical protein
VFFSLALGMGSEVPDFPAQIYAWRSGPVNATDIVQ